jgi:peptide/nickel transport system ATP-binding protein
LAKVHIEADDNLLSRYPFELSGGQQQRVALAMVMMCEPDILVLDEPTAGIDATTRVDVIAALRESLRGKKTAVIYISHDLTEIASIADQVVVMYAGEIVERGPAFSVFASPRHPYSAALLASTPSVRDARMVQGIPGRPPGRIITDRCSFAERCSFVRNACIEGSPSLLPVAPDYEVRCVRASEIEIDLRRFCERQGLQQHIRSENPPLLELSGLNCVYRSGGTVIHAVKDVSLVVGRGEKLSIVGESGSGKSTLLHAIAGLHPPSGGTMFFQGRRLPGWSRQRHVDQHRLVQLVFQNPGRSLNPRHTVARILESPIRLFRPDIPRADRYLTASALLEKVQLSPTLLGRFPYQLSGGEKQRVALARAFAANPKILLLDEVVSALDVSVQAAMLQLVHSYSFETGASVLFVTHDLAVARVISDRIAVLQKGQICEMADAETLFLRPTHPYTITLLNSVLSRNSREGCQDGPKRGELT